MYIYIIYISCIYIIYIYPEATGIHLADETCSPLCLRLNLSAFYEIVICIQSLDPCDNYKIMAEGKRATGYKLNGSDVAISDDRLEPGWYKIVNEGGTEIPTEAPGTMSCGTLFPIWLKGLLFYFIL